MAPDGVGVPTDYGTHRTLDLSSVAGGPYIGDASVWVAFRFESDSSNTGEGAYIDNVELVTGTGSSLGNPPTTGITPRPAR